MDVNLLSFVPIIPENLSLIPIRHKPCITNGILQGEGNLPFTYTLDIAKAESSSGIA